MDHVKRRPDLTKWHRVTTHATRRALRQPNKEIRVLKLLSSNDHTIKFVSYHISIDSSLRGPVRYKALSYMCGAEPASHTILVDGHPLQIRPNLHAFLRILRTPHSKKWFSRGDLLWIDAISIDQENVEERNHQVGLMSKVYSQAQLVLVWLGWPDKGGAIANLSRSRSPDSACSEDSERKASLVPISSRPYWNRLWIVQEVLLAPSLIIILGDEHTSLDIFSNKLLSPSQAQSLYMWRRLDRPRTARLVQAIQSFDHQECSEMKDKLFAILSLVEGGPQFPIDYNDSVPVIFWKALHHFKAVYGIGHDDDTIAAAKLLLSTFRLQNISDGPESEELSEQTRRDIDPVASVFECASFTISGSRPSQATGQIFAVRINIVTKDALLRFRRIRLIYSCGCEFCSAMGVPEPCFDPTKPIQEDYTVCRLPSIRNGLLVFSRRSAPHDRSWRCVALGLNRESELSLYHPPGAKVFRVEPRSVEGYSATYLIDVDLKVLADLLRYEEHPKHMGAIWKTYGTVSNTFFGIVSREHGRLRSVSNS